ncbi:MAG TPA: hypothetical protein VNX27_07265 [Chthoniobacterales bacterium]|jgi:hypothetical protein|nr:hypothetical protein [Chthoniobacterales bacterium]
MKRFPSLGHSLARCEFAVAILLTLVLIVFHFLFFFHAGPLWRDEISSLSLATKPTFSEFWQSLTFDPFPASYFLVLRLWHAIGLAQSDLALRGLGLVIGLALIGSLWLASYLADKSPPVWALALFAFNPLALEVGDSLRPYGFSLIWIVLVFGLIARITFARVTKIIALCALIAAILSVQSNFTNALVLFSIAAGAVVVLLSKRAWSKLFLVLGIGVSAAFSLLPYLPIMQATRDWSKILANENDIASVIDVARDAIATSGVFAQWIWLALIVGTLVVAVIVTLVRRRSGEVVDVARDRIIFATTVLVVAAAVTIGFLCAAKYLVFPRYFLAVLAIGALCINSFWKAIPNQTATRTLSFCLALIVAATSLQPLSGRAHMRMTNCDKISAVVENRAGPDDLIILTSPLYGISFQRYYQGRANWIALPQLGDFSLHRWDLLKQAIAEPDPVPDLLSRAENVLRADHKIFLVGKLGPAPATEPEPLPPAPNSQFGWQMEAYTNQWKSELTYSIEHRARHGTNLPVGGQESVNPFEHLGLFEVSGSREP